jgi:hypothetical protein
LIAAVKRWRQIAVGVLSVVGRGGALFAVGFYWLMSSFEDLCGNTIVATELSPDRKLKAVLFERNCGATTGFSSQVSVLPSDRDLPNEGGNVFAANEARGGEQTTWGARSWRCNGEIQGPSRCGMTRTLTSASPRRIWMASRSFSSRRPSFRHPGAGMTGGSSHPK